MRLRNETLEVRFTDTPMPMVSCMTNHLSGRTVAFTNHEAAVVIEKGESAIPIFLDQLQLIEPEFVGGSTLCVQGFLTHAGIQLRVKWTYELTERALQCYAEITNTGDELVHIKDIVLLSAKVDAQLEGRMTTIDLSQGEADFMSEQDVGSTLGYPVFIGDHMFCGIDWPTAESVVYGERVYCRQLCADDVSPGETLLSRTLSIGAANEGQVSAAFLQHLAMLRGRPTRRASFYFDWLTHSWEGLTEHELSLQMDFFRTLKETFGIMFDIYAVDAGIVETNRYYYDSYKLMLERLLPQGLGEVSKQAQDIGMEFGIWLGPGGFGKTEADAKRRIDVVANMVQQWHVSLIKFDCAVSSLFGEDIYENEHLMRKFEKLIQACRKNNPNLIIINHRVTFSPYILTLMDSTLWEGRETYPDVHIMNTDKPRLFSRQASYRVGEPTYFGQYSDLLEDHGICFNGDLSGWSDEFVIQAFGRALMLSPEVYGSVFLLPDEDYLELARLMSLAKTFRAQLAQTRYSEDTGDFIQTDGRTAVLCCINDSWKPSVRRIRLDADLGLSKQADFYQIVQHYPISDETGLIAIFGAEVELALHPFGVALFEIRPAENVKGSISPASARLFTLPKRIFDKSFVELGHFEECTFTAREFGVAEICKFKISSDPTEAQVIQRTPISLFKEIQASRDAFLNKIKSQHGIASNAWDDNPTTAWGDAYHWQHLENIWRIDLGRSCLVRRIEVILSEIAPGTVFDEGQGRMLKEPVRFDVSADGETWYVGHTVVFRQRQGFMRAFTSALISDFEMLPEPVRYVRFHVNGIMVRDIRVKTEVEGKLLDIDRSEWHGCNLLTDRQPVCLFRKQIHIDETWAGRYVALVAQLPENVKVPLLQETAVVWVEASDGTRWYATEASPAYPFHGWEWNTHHEGNAWTYRFAVEDGMVGRELNVNLAWYGPVFSMAENGRGFIATRTPLLPEIQGYLVTVHAR